MKPKNRTICFIQEYSLPLIAGVFAALAFANLAPHAYETVVHGSLLDLFRGGNAHEAAHHDHHHHGPWDHYFTLHFWVNEVFMVLFFGIAAKEITESCLPGGALNPFSKAINPLLGTLGGILGPVGVFIGLNLLVGQVGWSNGWGIPTATDIALAWLVARFVFGKGHPAISFLLLLAVADDAIGLGIIAIAYPNPELPTNWLNTLWVLPGMAIAYGLRRLNVQSWYPYILVGGAFSWWGLYSAHLHPALALVFIVPFLPAAKRDLGLFVNELVEDEKGEHPSHGEAPIDRFEHDLKLPVDFGLFFFAFANAGVAFSGINNLTWIILVSLIAGKMIGITFFSWVGTLIGFRLPQGMAIRDLVVASCIAGIGLTVALFVSGQAFTDAGSQGAAKMGSLFSAGAFIVALGLAKVLGVGANKRNRQDESDTGSESSDQPKPYVESAKEETRSREQELVEV